MEKMRELWQEGLHAAKVTVDVVLPELLERCVCVFMCAYVCMSYCGYGAAGAVGKVCMCVCVCVCMYVYAIHWM